MEKSLTAALLILLSITANAAEVTVTDKYIDRLGIVDVDGHAYGYFSYDGSSSCWAEQVFFDLEKPFGEHIYSLALSAKFASKQFSKLRFEDQETNPVDDNSPLCSVIELEVKD